MSVFERMQGFSSRGRAVTDSVFDVTKPEGAFLHCVHKQGYKMYNKAYSLKEEFRIGEGEYDNLSVDEQQEYDCSCYISAEDWSVLSEAEKAKYEEKIEYTELHNVLTTCGNQIINATAGSGKALKNGTKVLTNKGFKPVEELEIGDLVCGENGVFYVVEGVFPQGLKEVYVVYFSNGEEIQCSGDHLWSLEDGTVKTTLELSLDDTLPLVRPVSYPSSPEILPIRPYLLGVLIKAMDFGISNLTVNVKKSVAGKVNGLVSEFSGVSTSIMGEFPEDDSVMLQIIDSSGELECLLKELGYENDKFFIPRSYLMAGVGERFDLLEGILDSDAMYSEGYYSVVHTNEYFLNDLLHLCRSLGCFAKKRNNLTVNIWSGTGVKLHGCDEKFPDYNFVFAPKLCVTGIRRLDYEAEMTCIKVSNPSSLFLTENFIPTHNTTALTFKIIHDIVTGEAKTLRAIPNGTQVSVVNKMWVCTFLKSGAMDLAETVSYWQRALGYTDSSSQISFSTLDAEFKRCLNAMGVATPIGSGDVIYKCLVSAIQACNITRDGYALTKDDYQIIGGIVTYYRGRLDDTKYRHPSCSDYSLTPSILDLLVHQFANNRAGAGVMDFEEIMELLYKYLYIQPNRAVQDFVANRYNFIYIDEFQDTSQMAYAILKFYGRGRLWLNRSGSDVKVVSEGGTVVDGLYTAEETKGKVVVVGDISQCLIEGQSVQCGIGSKRVECIVLGDYVQSCAGVGETCFDEVVNISKKFVETRVYEVHTENHSIVGTADHKVFGVRPYGYMGSEEEYETETSDEEDFNKDYEDYDRTCEFELYLVGKDKVLWSEREGGYKFFDSYEKVEEYMRTVKYQKNGFCDCALYEKAIFEPVYLEDDNGNLTDRSLTSEEFIRIAHGEDVDGISEEYVGETFLRCDVVPLMLAELNEGDLLLIYENGKFKREKVIEVKPVAYSGYVYDISTKECHNYITDGIISHNCIYSFRGSDSRILAEDFDNDFRPVISELSVNWRCPTNILNPVIPSIHKNEDSASQKIIASHEGGEFKAYRFANYKLMLEQLKEDLNRDMRDNMKAVILCRTNYDGMVPAFMLESDRHFNFGISDSKMTMDSPLPKSIIGMTSLFTERTSPAVERSLKMIVPRRMQWQVTELIKVLKLNNKSIWDLDLDDIEYSCNCILDFVSAVRKVLFVDGKRDKSMELQSYQLILFYLMQNVYNNDSTYSEGARAFIEAILFIISSNDFKTIYDFLDEIEYLNDRLNGRIGKKNAPLQIATVHEYKGKECDSVYIWNDSDGVFPSSKCDIGDTEQLNEERRVHYIACTRAKKREHIYCMSSKVGMFVNEMDLTLESPKTVSTTLKKSSSPLEGCEVLESL